MPAPVKSVVAESQFKVPPKRSSRDPQFEWDATDDTTVAESELSVYHKKRRAEDSLMGSGVHYSKKRYQELNARDIRLLRSDYKIMIKGDNAKDVVAPVRSWSDLSHVANEMVSLLDKMYKDPSPI